MPSGGSPQHLVMDQSYINILGTALQEFQTGNQVSQTNPLQQIYKDLAWGGLTETIAYTTPFSVGGLLTPQDKTRINAVNNSNEQNLPKIDTSNNQTQLPTGTACN
jgi:hypothetical protein